MTIDLAALQRWHADMVARGAQDEMTLVERALPDLLERLDAAEVTLARIERGEAAAYADVNPVYVEQGHRLHAMTDAQIIAAAWRRSSTTTGGTE